MIEIGRELAHVQRDRLVSDVALVIVGHFALLAPVAFLIWPEPGARTRLAWWIAVVGVTTIARGLWQRRGRDAAVSNEALIAGIRVLIALQGLAWGVGLALLFNVITEEQRAIVLIGFAGLLASATHTLVGDRRSITYLLAGTYLPVLIALGDRGMERGELVLAMLILLFAAVVLSLHRRARDLLIVQLRTARTLRTLEGILPICASCKRIHTDQGNWQPVESYVRDHSEAEFSHGLCPDCAARDWGAARVS